MVGKRRGWEIYILKRISIWVGYTTIISDNVCVCLEGIALFNIISTLNFPSHSIGKNTTGLCYCEPELEIDVYL